MDPFHLLSQYFWVVCLAMSAFNYFAARRQAAASSAFNVSQNEEAARYFRWFSLAAAAPWIVMGLGQLSGFTPTVWYYFRPQDLNPFVIAWLACIFLLALIYAVWVLLLGGARKVHELQLLSAVGMR